MNYDSYPFFYNTPPHSYYPMREMPFPPPHPFPPPKPYPPAPEPPPVECPKPDMDYYTYPANLEKALNLIEESVMGEAKDKKFYEGLIKLCEKELCSKEAKKIIESIILDEKKHGQLLRTIYCEITGHVLPEAPEEKITMPKTCCEGIEEAIFDELAAVERYRRILYAMKERRHINMLVEIITDEQKHAHKLNYLYSRNECGSKCPPKK